MGVATADEAGVGQAEIGILPAATTYRFILLMVTLAAGSLSLNYILTSVLAAKFPSLPLNNNSCFRTLSAEIRARNPDFGINFDGCTTAHVLVQGLTAMSVVPVIAALAWFLYRMSPRLTLRFAAATPLVDLADVVSPRVRSLVEEQVALAGRHVDVLVTASRPTADGRALGCYPRYQVLLDLGLLASAERDERRLRAVLGHEVAHIRNRDIDITYLAMSLWWAFLLIEVPAYVLMLILTPVAALESISWRALLLMAIVWLARASVLRTREYYADRALGSGTQAADSLTVALTSDAARERAGWAARVIRAVSYHPGARDRLTVLADPTPLLRLAPVDCFVAGALIGLSYSPLEQLLASFGLNTGWADPLLGLIFGLLAGGLLAAGLWREALLRLRSGRLPADCWRQAISFATGIVVGQFTIPPGWSAGDLYNLLLPEPVVALVIVAVLYFLCYLLLKWISVCASCWLPVSRSTKLASVAGTVVAVVVCGSWISYWFRVLELLGSSTTPWRLLLLMGQASALLGFTPLALALAVAYPAAAWAYLRLRGGPGRIQAAQLASVPVGIAVAAFILIAATFVPLAYLATIRHEVLANGGIVGILTVSLRLYAVAAAVAGTLVGLAFGRRGTVAQCAVSAGLGALIAAPYTVWCSFFYATYSVRGNRGVLGVLAEVPFRSWLDLGPLMTIWFASLAGAGMAGVMAGSVIPRLVQVFRGSRTVRPAPPGRRRPVRGTAALLVTMVAATILIGYQAQDLYNVATASLASRLGGRSLATAAKQQRVLPFHSMTRLAACLQIRAVYQGVQQASLTGNEQAVTDAQVAADAYESDDGNLASLAVSLGKAMSNNQVARVAPLVGAITWYCAGVFAHDKPTPAANGSG